MSLRTPSSLTVRPKSGRMLLPAVAAATTAVFAPTDANASITAYTAGRQVSYIQSSNAAPTMPDAWNLVSVAISDVPNEIVSATLSLDVPPPTMHPLIQGTPYLHQFVSTIYASEAPFLANYPATTYTMTIDRGVGPPESASLFLPEDMYSAVIPAFTFDTYDRLQFFEPALPFTGTINGFTPAPGTNRASTNVVIVEEGVGGIYTESFTPDETSFVIPGGLLQPATNYSISVAYFNAVIVPDAGFGFTAESGAEFYRSTTIYFTTLPESCSFTCEGDFPVSAVCDQTGQICGNPQSIQVATCGPIVVSYTASSSHCSLVGMIYYVDGVVAGVADPVGPGETTPPLSLGLHAPGNHLLEVDAYGVTGGCNPGVISDWGGVIHVYSTLDVSVGGPEPLTAVCAGGSATFTATASGTVAPTFNWRKNGVDLLNGPTPTGSIISGAGTATLQIDHCSRFDAGSYDCLVTFTSCSTPTNASSLTVSPFADINLDGMVGLADVAEVINCWSFPAACNRVADLDDSGAIGLGDVAILIQHWAEHCP